MPEPSDRDERPPPSWPLCSRHHDDGCIGIRIGTTAYCLAHLEEEDSDQFKAFITSLKPGASLDLRGTQFSPELLSQLLAALKTNEGSPTIGWSLFSAARFRGWATFDGVHFLTSAMFDATQFTGDATFNGVQFSGAVIFNGAQFSRRATFNAAQFSEDTTFNAVEFSDTARFDRAQFMAPVMLGPLRARLLSLKKASFRASVVIEVAAHRLAMVETRFDQEVTIRVRYADVLLDAAAFAKPASIAFTEMPYVKPGFPFTDISILGVRFPWRSVWPNTTLDETSLEEMGLSQRPRLLSLRRVDATNLVLNDLDLARCLFRGAHNLDKLRIEGPKHFASTPKTWRWTERRILAEEQLWRYSHHKDWRIRSDLLGKWDEAYTWVEKDSGQPMQKPDPDHVAPLYRALRKAEEDAKYEPGAADFYYGEMEMRRHAQGTPWVEKRLLWAYWLVSGYGLRGLRALLSSEKVGIESTARW
jgi:uncharacterized protein YjbI with pentapeptide repeats